ncbi:MAG: H-X9-DG-CTERM domain-containing protein [Victivallales bacterium]
MTAKNNLKRMTIRYFTLTELLLVTAIVTSIPAGTYLKVKQKAVETECMNNMRQVGMAIVTFQISNGEFPKAAFFPEKPKTDKNSIRVILGDEIHGDKVWICPAMPDELKDKGLTWVYNDTLAGKATVKDPEKTWLLIEFTCVSKKTPPAHPGGFNIVYADGHVATSKILPEDITKSQQAMLDELIKGREFACRDCNFR